MARTIEKLQVYRCEICGNIIEVVHAGKPALVCCGKPMKLLEENTTDAALEKHVPVVEKAGSKITVKVGSVLHPMENDHYIEWIEVLSKERSYTKFLKPGDAPEAEFELETDDEITVRAYCNLHGLWKA
ncbi:MAG: desulfoferrodoxin [Deltaproteobacteria bacterium]|nr:desulfoferrodoxin [Deltaproteobacteria bacterium]